MNRTVRFVLLVVLVALATTPWWHRHPTSPAATPPESAPAHDDRPEPAAAPALASTPALPTALPAVTAAPPNADARSAALERIAAFSAWVARTQPSRSAPMSAAATAEGLALARDRRAALKELIRLDPRAALAAALPGHVRQQLPGGLVAQLETSIAAFGRLEVISICDETAPRVDRFVTLGAQTYAAYTSGERLHAVSKEHLPVNGIAVDDVLALCETPYAPLEAPPAAASADATVTAQVGDTTQTFASAAALDAWAAETAAGEANPNAIPTGNADAAALSTAWTTGEKSVLWIRVEFTDDPGSPGTDAQIATAMTAANALFQDVSHATCSLKGTVIPGTLVLATPKATYETSSSTYTTLRSDAQALARAYDAANGGTGKYNPDNYDRYIVLHKHVTAYTWSGIATVGAKGLLLNGTTSGAVTAHELGHNQGLRHSHAWIPTDGSAISSAGIHAEYGDAFDDMGSGQSGDSGGHFNAAQKYNLGYLTTNDVQTVTQSGKYRIYRHDDRAASGVQALKVASSWAGTNYWVEYRRAAPYPLFAAPSVGTPEMPRLQNGVVVHWDRGPSFTSGPGTYLLDMTPTTTSGVPAPSDYSGINHVMDDAALALGEMFADPAANLMLTPVAVGGTAPNEWIDVYVTVGAVTGNHPPTISALSAAARVNARIDTALTATASDPDGDTVYYRWDFGDNAIATATTATVTHHWLKGGTYTVKCTAVDGRGGSTTSTTSVAVDDPLLSWERRASSLTARFFYDVLFDGTKFVAVASYAAATSTDGINWTLATGITSKNYNYAVAYGNNRYVAVGAIGGSSGTAMSIITSENGTSWTDESPATSSVQLLSVTYGAGRFVAVGDGGMILSSADGLAWTNVSTANTNSLKVVRFAAGRFVIAGASGTYLTSADGVTWQDVSLPGETSTAYGLVYYRGSWLSITSSYPVADTTKRVAWQSTDGVTWTKAYIDVDASVATPTPIANGAFLLGVSRANDGRIFFAETATGDWNAAAVFPASAIGSATNLSAVAEGNGTIVVVGLSGQLYSPSAGVPVLAALPTNQTIIAGQNATFTAPAYASAGTVTYQWMKNGAAIAGATTGAYVINNATTADAGSYSVTATNSSGSVTAPAATLTVGSAGPSIDPARLTNLSIRSGAGTGDQTLTVGVSVSGGADGFTKPLLIRAIGPTLAGFGVSTPLADPVLSVVPLGESAAIASNDGWRGDAQIRAVAASVGAFELNAAQPDAALFLQFERRGYTMQVTGKTGTGVALVEVYDATASGTFTSYTPRLMNVSARTQVGVDDNVLIAGFNIAGTGTKRLLIRAWGPTLAKLGLSGTLADPTLTVYPFGKTNVLASNNDWGDDPALISAANSVGAFPLVSGSKDAALIVELPPGLYSAVVSGVGRTAGVALVEVYDLP